jgi:hypothetical protein
MRSVRGCWRSGNTNSRRGNTKGASAYSFVSFALSDFRVSKLLALNPNDNQGVRFLLYDLDEGLSWEESVAWDEEHTRGLEGR